MELGGAEKHVYELARSQASMGLRVDVVSFYGDNQFSNKSENRNLRFIELRCRNTVQAYIELSKILKETNPDVVHSHLPEAEIVSSLLRQQEKLRKICTRHCPGNYSHRFKINWFLPISKWVLSKQAQVVAVSEEIRESLIAIEGLSETKITVIDHALDVENSGSLFFENQGNRKANPQVFKIISVSRLEPQKDLQTLLKAISRLVNVNDASMQFKVDIFGSGSQQRELQRQIKYLNLETIVALRGKTYDVAQELSNSDLFILTSLYEGLPIALIEAMMSGIEIVVSEIPSLISIIGTPYIRSFKVGDSEQLADQIEHAYSCWLQRKKLRSSVDYTDLLERFSSKTQAKKVVLLYKKSAQEIG